MTDIKLICLDMDGTLLGADHATVPARNVRAPVSYTHLTLPTILLV